jgi:hypothetical protein
MDSSQPSDAAAAPDIASTADLATASDSGGPGNCGTMSCGMGQVCVKEHDSGGAVLILPDGGVCPPDHLPIGNGICVYDQTTYTCQPLPAACGATLSCACAATLCRCMCQGMTGDELDCVCLFP